MKPTNNKKDGFFKSLWKMMITNIPLKLLALFCAVLTFIVINI